MTDTLSDLLVCPLCKGRLLASPQKEDRHQELVCPRCALAFTVRDNIPVMIAEFARDLTDAERDALHDVTHGDEL